MRDEQNGYYFIQQAGRRKRSGRDIAFYNDRPSKITGELDVPHLELRLQNTGTVRRQGFDRVSDLIDLNPKELLAKHIKLVEVDIEAIKQWIIQNTLRDERLNHCAKRSKKMSLFIEQYRASLPHRLACQLDRIFRNRAQVIKDFFPEHVRKSKNIPVEVLGLSTRLDWRP